MHYQLFIPQEANQPAGTPQQALERLGLQDLIAGHEAIPKTGPEEKRGILFCWRKTATPNSFSFTPDKQTWIPAFPSGPEGEGRGRYWVGFWNDSPIEPEDLQRPYAHAGPLVELGDRQHWRIPEIAELPTDYIRDDDGSWKYEIQRQYHNLALEADDWRKRCFQQGDDQPQLDEVLDYCEKVLAQNYRLLPEVVSHLRLFNSTNLASVLHSCLSLV